MKKILILLLSLFCLNSIATSEKKFTFTKEKNKFHVFTSFDSQTTQITTESSDTSIESESDFSLTGQKIQGEYFINQMLSVTAGYFFGLIIDIDAEVQGFDLGVQYYFLNNGASKNIEILGSQLKTSPEWAPYLAFNASTRDYQFSSLNLKFQGFDLSGGTYWHFKDDYFLRGNVFFQQHINNNVRTMQSTGFGLGVGFKF